MLTRVGRISLVLAIVAVFALPGCSLGGSSGAGSPAVRPVAPDAQVIPVSISRTRYQAALAQAGGVNKARLVQIYSNDSFTSSAPAYRIFDVKSGSVYRLLKIEQADIILGAEGVSFPTPDVFFGYVSRLHNEDSATLQVRRFGQNLVYKYSFRS